MWRVLLFLGVCVVCVGVAGGCNTYGVLNREQTASVLGVSKEELKTPDTIRGR